MHKFVTSILMINLFIAMMGIGILIPIMPQYLETFGAGGQVYGFLLATFSFAQFVLSPWVGEISDRYGRKIFIVSGLILLGVSFVLFALADNVAMLFIARFLMGIGSAFIVPTIMAFAGDTTTIENRGKIMSWLGATMSLGLMIGPGIGGFLAEVSLEFPIYFSSVISLIAAVLTYFGFEDTKIDVSKSIVKKQKTDSIAKQLIQSIKKKYFMLLLIVFIYSLGLANFQLTLSLYLDEKFGYSPLGISVFLLVSSFIAVVLQLFILDKLFKKFGEMNVILYSLFFAVITMLLMIYVSRYFLILIVVVIFTVAVTFIRPAVNTLISKFADGEQGYAAGMNNAYMSLGTTIGPIMAGVLYDWKIDFPFIIGSIILLISYILCRFWIKKVSESISKAH